MLTHAALTALFLQCAPQIAPQTLQTLVGIESDANEFAVAVVDGNVDKQPDNITDALNLINHLQKNGKNYSVGLMMINKNNFEKLGLSHKDVFDPCSNIKAGAKIFESCYARAKSEYSNDEQAALRGAFSCYYSDNFTRGFKKEFDGKSYVDLVEKEAGKVYSVPAIQPNNNGSDSASAKESETDIKSVNSTPAPARQAWDVYGDFK